MYIYFHIYTCIHGHKYTHMIIQNHTYIHVYIHKYIKGNTHIYLATNACYTVSSNENLEKKSAVPRSGAASVGVKKVNSLEELRATYEARRWHFGVGKILKVYLNKSPTCYHENQLRAPKKWTGYSVLLSRRWLSAGLEPNFFRLVSSDETGKRTPSPLGGFLVLSFGIFPFNFFLGGFDFFGSKIFWVFWVVVDFGRLEVWVKDLVMNIQVLTNQIWNKKINSFFF